MPLRDRTAPELVMLILAATVGLLLLAAVVLVGVLEIVRPETDTGDALDMLASTITILVGAIVGYLAGRGAKEKEGRS